MTRCYLGQFVAPRALLEQCHGLGDPALRSIGAGQDTYATMLAQLAVTLALLGDIDQARVRLSEAFSEARRFRQGLTLPNVLVRANWIASITRSTEMQQHTEELLALSTEHGFPLYLGFGLVYRGLWLNALGQAQDFTWVLMLSVVFLSFVTARAAGPVGVLCHEHLRSKRRAAS